MLPYLKLTFLSFSDKRKTVPDLNIEQFNNLRCNKITYQQKADAQQKRNLPKLIL